MASSWTEFAWGSKSRLSALARSCFLRRRHWRQKCFETRQALAQVEESLAQSELRCQQLEQQNQAVGQQVAQLQRQLAAAQPVVLPVGEPPPGQHYGANLIALSVNLERALGIRPAQKALKIFSRG